MRVIQCDFSKTKEEKTKLKLVHTKLSPKGQKVIQDDSIGKLTVYVKNPSKRINHKTTYSTITEYSNIITYLDINNIKKESINKIYFKNKPYVW